MAIKHIIFDWGGVLGEGNNFAAARTLSQKYGLDQEKLYRAFSEEEHKYSDGTRSYHHFYETPAHEFGIPLKDIIKALTEVPANPKNFAVPKLLKSKGFKVHLLSNQLKPRTDAIKKDNDLSVFDTIWFSNEIGFAKPDPAIYYYVLERIGAKAEECLFVDDKQENVQAAEATGMKGLQYTFPNKLKDEVEEALNEN